VWLPSQSLREQARPPGELCPRSGRGLVQLEVFQPPGCICRGGNRSTLSGGTGTSRSGVIGLALTRANAGACDLQVRIS
jgi:hypothetical protein